ncbi:MAG: hypothetical protein J6S67_23405 [Methanobrevibacter sp.]|nr:hypothetical protein [Methanobrevibacter sp.]
MRLTNLLKETNQVLANHRITWNAIKFIRNSTGYIEMADFVKEAANITYDADHGDVHIDPTLKIVGGSWWLERGIYDGLEGWVFCRKPDPPTIKATQYHLTTDHLSPIEIDREDYQNRIELYNNKI